jgi:hypothetical protein
MIKYKNMKQPISKEKVLGLSHNSKLLKEYKISLHISYLQWEVAIGLMLGDASLQTQNNGKTYLLFFEDRQALL